MHGRPRQKKGVPVDPEKAKAKEVKFQQFRQLTNAVLKIVEDGRRDEAALAQSAKLLQKNPDVYTIWNYRRAVLSSELEGEHGSDTAKARAVKELKITEAALMENPKSYSAWYHRLWIMRKGLTSPHEELALITRLLQMDSRNFHAWKYRREIAELAGVPIELELAYTRSLIDANFSNYSAWHTRSRLLPQLHESHRIINLQDLLQPASSREEKGNAAAESAARAEGPSQPPAVPLGALEEEYELAQQAFFTDPEDQSAYMYHQWLLSMTLGHYRVARGSTGEASAKESLAAVLRREEGRCRELLEAEPDRRRCKWPMLSLAGILGLRLAAGTADAGTKAERAELLADLAAIDPLRKGFYNDGAPIVRECLL